MDRSLDRVEMDKIVSLCKRRGFIFQSSEIYGGLASTYDYGPLGVEMKRNIRDSCWKRFIQDRDDMVGLDAAILMHPQVWVASGHADTFTDPLVECRACHHRFRADHLESDAKVCPDCGGGLTDPRNFNLMFKTFIGPVGGLRVPGLPAPGDGPGHLRQLPERPGRHPQAPSLWHWADWQGLPQRDYHGQLHISHP